MDPLILAAAAFFRIKGKNVVTETEFVMGISMDLRWMPHREAKELLVLLIAEGHLKDDGQHIRPSFDVHATDVPLGFKPSADILRTKRSTVKKAAGPPAGDILAELMEKAGTIGLKKKDFIVSVNAVQKRMNVDIEIAALLMLRENGADISEYIDRVRNVISER
ncbi:MAG: DUF2240 family protein [Methanomassiliicoccaceae archaeon]|nr:DUF2240 family protein [Methanomassiliicoccaceae archaeon]